MISAVGMTESMASLQGAGPGSTPRAALQQLKLIPIPVQVAKQLLEREHYLHSLPGGTMLSFGAFIGRKLLGAITLGAGPYLAHSLVDKATRDDCIVLTRLWLSDELPPNSESHVIGVILRFLKRHTQLKFVLTYADPSAGHVGTIYQASGWLYIGLSSSMPLYDIGDGIARHSRSVAHDFGSHSKKYFSDHGIEIKTVPQEAKHRYIKFLDESWRNHLLVPLSPYPKRNLSMCKTINSEELADV